MLTVPPFRALLEYALSKLLIVSILVNKVHCNITTPTRNVKTAQILLLNFGKCTHSSSLCKYFHLTSRTLMFSDFGLENLRALAIDWHSEEFRVNAVVRLTRSEFDRDCDVTVTEIIFASSFVIFTLTDEIVIAEPAKSI